MPTPCPACLPLPHTPSIRASARPHHIQAPPLSDLQRLWPVAARFTQAATVLGVLVADHEDAVWPLAGRGWWPRPLRVRSAAANAAWTCTQCPRCTRFLCKLIAIKDVLLGALLAVDAALPDPILGQPRDTGYELTFDGAARGKPDSRHSGAAAVLWGPPSDNGLRPVIATRHVALPTTSKAEHAEAHGASLAIQLLLAYCLLHPTAAPGPIAIGGDNPNIIRFCGTHGHTAQIAVHEIFAGPLGALALSGRSVAWILIPRSFNTAAHVAAGVAAGVASTCTHPASAPPVPWDS